MSVDTVVGRYGIDARFNHDLVEIRPDKREAVFVQKNDPAKARVTIGYDILHVAPADRAGIHPGCRTFPPIRTTLGFGINFGLAIESRPVHIQGVESGL
jgi:hypothetical protein